MNTFLFAIGTWLIISSFLSFAVSIGSKKGEWKEIMFVCFSVPGALMLAAAAIMALAKLLNP